MPYKDPTEQRKATRLHYLKNRERIRKERYLKAQVAKLKDKPMMSQPTPRSSPQIQVSYNQRWMMFDGEVFFCTTRGFSPEELEMVMEEIQQAKKVGTRYRRALLNPEDAAPAALFKPTPKPKAKAKKATKKAVKKSPAKKASPKAKTKK